MIDVFASPRLQPLRLISGLILFAFAFLHFANHAFGLIGLAEMNAVQDWRISFTHSTPVRIILLAAILIHMLLGLGKLAARRTLRLPPWEWLQILSGVLIPALLIPHAVSITYLSSFTSFFYSYTSVAFNLWLGAAAWQSSLLLIVWVHGCIGLNFWLRTKPWYAKLKLPLLAAAVALPILALTGFMSAGREAHALLADPAALAKARTELSWPTASTAQNVDAWRNSAWQLYAAVLALVLATYIARHTIARRVPAVAVSYAGGPVVKTPIGASLLEISRLHGVPHTSVCGGRARCSTCRVRVDQGNRELPKTGPVEQATLDRIGAPANVRLACQLRPTSDIAVTRLVAAAGATAGQRIPHAGETGGVEKHVAVLFLDLRGFTKLSENRLPFDIVFLLNQFFAIVGEAIRTHDGWIDKYMGDGLMAVFGRDAGVEMGCRQALAAARDIDLTLDIINARLAAEISKGLRIGIGIHAGPVVIGEIGDPHSAVLTVIGQTVNEASRLEALTKDKECQLILSKIVADHAGANVAFFAAETVEVRGSGTPIEIIMINAARELLVQTTPVTVRKRAAVRKSIGLSRYWTK